MIRLGSEFGIVRSRFGASLAAAAVALSAFALGPSPASAEYGVTAFDGQVTANSAGTPFTQAGGHPFSAGTTIEFNTKENPGSPASPIPDGNLKDVEVDLPAGFIGNPNVTPLCPAWQISSTTSCPLESQVGVASISAFGLPGSWAPVFATKPPPGVAAAFAFSIQGFITNLYARVRTGDDYGVTIDVEEISQGLPVAISTVTLWGVPTAEVHDSERCKSIQGSTGSGGPLCVGEPGTVTGPNGVVRNELPLLRNPTSCTPPGVGLKTAMRTDSWQKPGEFKEASFISHEPPGYPLPSQEWGPEIGVDECDRVPFTPRIDAAPTTNAADAPSGLSFDLTIPQDELKAAGAVSQADLKRARVIFPKGMTVNPGAADGLGSCSSAQVELGSPKPATCPDDSKIGSVSIESPLVDHVLRGGVYLAAQGDNPFGSLLAIYIAVADAKTGVVIKLPGHVIAADDGQLETVFDDQPQLPFEALHLDIFGGPRAPLRTPAACGAYETQAILVPWSGRPPVSRSSAFQITQGPNGGPCPNGSFDPQLSAGTTNPVAGTYSPFVLRLTRNDGTQELSGITARLPKGLVGKLAGMPYCADAALAGISVAEGAGAAQVASPVCPAASQIGTVSVGAGAGLSPFYVNTGKVYLAGPYKGAPLSMAFVTPAVAGPFDLGNVVVRAALQVDQGTAQITAVSDPLPHILYGIPLDLRDVRVNVDHSDFTLNPTSCDPMAITSTITSVGGAQAHPASRFQVGNCASLPFRPKLKLHLKGSTTRTGHPALKAVVTYPKEGTYANIARAQVGLPHSEFLDQGNLNKVCKQADLHAGTCPKSSIYGWAKAWTPLLDKPLQGPVYLGVGFGYKLPALVADLNGQIRIMLVGRVDTTKRDGIRNTFEVVPDAPVSRFVLRMKGGKKYGLLENSENTCRKKQRASALFIGQNGDRLHMRPRIHNGCGKAKRNKAKRKAHARASSQRQAAHGGRGRE